MPAANIDVEFLIPFIAPHLQRYLASREAGPTEATEATVEAAALVADIAGFTALTEAFEAAHTEGADKLSELLDELFDLLNGIIEAHGGESVHLAGDGLLAIWPVTEDRDLGASVRDCASAGLRIQEQISERNALADHAIRMRIGIGGGPIWMPVVGGDTAGWYAPLGGPPLEQIAEALNAARPGDVIVSVEAARAAGAAVVGVTSPQGLVRAEDTTFERTHRHSAPVELSGPVLATFVPETVATRAQAGMTGRFAELRQATTVFVQVRGLPTSPGVRLEHLQAVTTAFQQAVVRYDGTVSVMLLDEKGLSLAGTWGGSGHAHEDDATRALRAAMSFVSLVDLDTSIGVGVATGRTYLGDVGARAIRRFTVLGRPVNLAARLAAADPGSSVRCDAATMVAARRDIAFEEHESVTLKGVGESTRTFRPVVAIDVARGESASMVGRHRERAVLRRMFEEFLAGTGGLVFVEGEAGIGKSTLVRELMDAAETHPIRRLVARGSALDQSTPYHPWRAVFHTLTGESQPIESVVELLDPDDRNLGELLSVVLSAEAGSEVVGTMSPHDRAEATRRVLTSAFVALTADARLMLVLEDAHWYDTASWSLIESVVTHCPDALVICVTRGLSDPPDQAELRLRRETAVLRLQSLDLDETVALACNRLDVPSIPEELVRLLYDRTEGHPLFTEELIRSLRDAAVLEITGASREVGVDRDALERLGVPSSVSAIIASRIDRLPLSHQDTLKVASVIGRSFSIHEIERVHPESVSSSEIKAHLEEAVALDLIEFNDQGESGEYRFSHILTAEAIYRLLSTEFREQLHLALATQGRVELPDSVLAHHWRSAGLHDAAAACYDRAARAAFESGANREVTELLSTLDTLEYDEDPPMVAARRHSMRGAAHVQLGELDRGHQHLLRAVELVDMPMPDKRWRLMAGLFWQLLRQFAHRIRVRPLRGTADVERIEVGSAAYWQMATTTFSHQDALGLAYSGIRATNEAERIRATRTLAQGYSFISYATGLIGLERTSEAYHRRALEAARSADSPIAGAEALLNRGVMLTSIGRWEDASDVLGAAAEQYGRLGSRTDRGRALSVRAYVHFQSGQFDEAHRLWGAVGEIGSDSDLVRAWITSGQGRSLARMGRLSESIGTLRAGRHLIDEVGELPTQVAALGFYGLALWQEGRLDAAVEAATAGLEMIEGTEAFSAPHSFDGIAEITRVLLEASAFNPNETSQRLAERATRSLGRMARRLPIARPRASMARAVLLARRGRKRAARRRFRKAIELAEAMAMPYERALIMRELGLALGDRAVTETAAEALMALGALEDARLSHPGQRGL
jgi:class 3 adenylate cyclase/tetratricopeptide (TPR) repeat protein